MDLVVFRWLNGFGTKSDLVDLAAWVITDYDWMIFTGIFVLYFLFHIHDRSRMQRVIAGSVMAGLLTLVVAHELGEMIYRPRPFVVLPFDQAQLLLPQNSDSSFMSELGAISVAFAAGMWRAPGRTARWVFSLLAFTIGFTQVFVGFHWPSDILASWALGLIIAHGALRWLPRSGDLLNAATKALAGATRRFRL